MSNARKSDKYPVNMVYPQIGFVKSVQSGNKLCVLPVSFREGEIECGPDELVVALSCIRAPVPKMKDCPEEPGASGSQGFLRALCLKQYVYFYVDGVGANNLLYGEVYTRKGEDVRAILVENGWAKVNSVAGKKRNNAHKMSQLLRLEELARERCMGVWSMEENQVDNTPEKLGRMLNPMQLFQKLNGKKVSGIVEQVKSGCNLRLNIPSLSRTVLVSLSGVECEAYDPELINELQKPYARAAQFFVELLALNCEVTLTLESINQFNQLLGTVWVGRCNLCVRLLEEGLARYDQDSATAARATELRQAEVRARESELGIWKGGGIKKGRTEKKETRGESFVHEGRVTEIVNFGGIRVVDKGATKEGEQWLNFSSITYPRYTILQSQDHPHHISSIEAYVAQTCREYLRRLLVGKTVKYSLDYTRPSNKEGEERKFHSVWFEGKNVALELVSKGLAKVVNHREGMPRSPIYQTLLVAENQAQKKQYGWHSTDAIRLPVVNYLVPSRRDTKPSEPRKRTQDQMDMQYLSRLQSYFPKLSRVGKLFGVVEKIITPARFWIWIGKEAVLLPFQLYALSIPPPSQPVNAAVKSAANQFVHDNLYQRDVCIVVESIDRSGDLSGVLYLNSSDFGLTLLQKGFAKLWTIRKPSASIAIAQYKRAEEDAKRLKLGLWEHWNSEDANKNTSKESNQQQKLVKRETLDLPPSEPFPVLVTNVTENFQFYFQKLDELVSPSPETAFLDRLQQLPVPGADFHPSKSVPIASISPSDNKWHRASLERTVADKYFVHFFDLGEKQTVSKDAIRPLPLELNNTPPLAHSARLAYIACPKSGDCYHSDCIEFFEKTARGKTFLCSIHYQEGGIQYAILHDQPSKSTVNAVLLENGFAVLDREFDDTSNSDQHLSEFREKQAFARDNHLGMWEYQNEINLNLEGY